MPRLLSLFLVLLVSITASAATHAEGHSHSHGSAVADTHRDTNHSSGVVHHEAGHADPHAAMHHGGDTHGGEHGGEHSKGDVVKHNIEHHLVDATVLELPGLRLDLEGLKFRLPFLDGMHSSTAEGNPIIVWRSDSEAGEAWFVLSKHELFMLLAVLVLLLGLLPVRGRIGQPRVHGWANFIESMIVFIRDEVVLPNTGEEGRRHMPFFLTVFFFILTMNLLGLIPFGASATGNLTVTAALALCAFGLIQWAGIRQHGFVGYFKGLVPHGVPIVLVLPLWVIEVFGLFTKPFALCVRLFANMMAGHAVIAAFLGLILVPLIAIASVPGSVAITLLELFVAFLQAYVFTMLTAIFAGGAIHQH